MILKKKKKTINFIKEVKSNDSWNFFLESKSKSKSRGLIVLAFLSEFKDTIQVNINNNKVIEFYKNDDSECSHCNKSHSLAIPKVQRNDKIIIFLKSAKKKVVFNLEECNRVLTVCYVQNHWFISYWPPSWREQQ